MGEVDRIQHVSPTPVVTPRVSEGGQRRQSQQQERDAPHDRVEIETFDEEVEVAVDGVEDLVEEPYRLDIAV